MAVNLSPVQLQQVDLPDIVHQILIDTGLPPSRLELEVTETALIRDLQRALDVLRRLKALGVSIAMDDFGTGYSSLSTLQAFPFDKIKIDRSFIDKVQSAARRRPSCAPCWSSAGRCRSRSSRKASRRTTSSPS